MIVGRCAFRVFTRALMLVATTAGGAWAQAGGSIFGTVKDPTGAMMPGVTVTLTNTALETQTVTTTDMQGAYSFPNVPVGRYDLLMTIEGFKPLRRTSLAVDINSRLQVDVEMEDDVDELREQIHARTPSEAVMGVRR